MIFHSIRWRLQLWHGLILVFVLTGFGVTAYQLQRVQQFRRVDDDLLHRLNVLVGELPGPRGPGRPRPPGEPPGGPRQDRPPDGGRFGNRDREEADGPPPLTSLRLRPRAASLFSREETNAPYYVIWLRGGRELDRSSSAPGLVPLPGRPVAVGKPQTRMRAEWREVYQYTPPGECLLVGRSVAAELQGNRRMAWWLGVAGGAVLALGLAGGWWFSTRAIRPIADISATAAKISTGDLSQRIPAAGRGDELGQLTGVLNSTFARLEAAFAQQARFTADASHELRTPVSVILAQTQSALTRDRPAAEYRETLEACQRAAQRMRRLIESLLELARLDAGQEPIKVEVFDLSRTAHDCLELVRPLAAERGITLRSELSEVPCRGDSERVAQVITNLLTNAIHHNPEQGEVRLTVSRDGAHAVLVVADNGPGIPAADLPHIFERFYRADKSRNSAQGRTGLGLAICKAIVEAHGGSIAASCREGAGSTFTVRLPAA